MSLIIHAPNVHQGGGRSLLLALLANLSGVPGARVILDARLAFPTDVPDGIVALRVRSSIAARLGAERRLRAIAGPGDTILCFGNLPPLFYIQGRVLLFMQNRYLAGNGTLRAFPPRVRARLAMERLWLRWGLPHVRQVVVQTPSMAREVQKNLGRDALVLPFAEAAADYERSAPPRDRHDGAQYDFLYVATGEPHKNHATLIEAWRLLAAEGVYPSLCLTVPARDFPELCEAIEHVRTAHGLKITNAGNVTNTQIRDLYAAARALIYPSIMESLGLPLIEARCANLPIIAAELDYVRDVIDPEGSFDPQSPVSIARSVKRFLGIAQPALPVLTPQEFLERILGGSD